MSVELREKKWYGVLGIEKVGVEGYWKKKTIALGVNKWFSHISSFFYFVV